MKKLLLEFGIIQIIGLIFKLTFCVRLLLVYKRLQSFSYLFILFINVYYNFLTFITSMVQNKTASLILRQSTTTITLTAAIALCLVW